MNNVFINLFNTVKGRIFGEFEVLNKDIHPDILKIIKVTKDKVLDGEMFTFKLNDNIDIYVIREINAFIYMDTLFVDGTKSVVCSIPYDLYNYEPLAVIKIVKSLYTYICNQLITKPGDTLYNIIISMAPIILTLHTLRNLYSELEISDFVDDNDNFNLITENVLYESLSYSIDELLDYCGILAICNEKIEKEIKNNESN